MSQANKVLGRLEQVVFPDFGGLVETAKIDTGAYTGALHCTKIRIEEGQNGKILHFSPFDHPELELSVDDFDQKRVKSTSGKSQQRYLIKTNIEIRGNQFQITLSLADRSEMKWAVLIGRKFLRENNYLVDVNH